MIYPFQHKFEEINFYPRQSGQVTLQSVKRTVLPYACCHKSFLRRSKFAHAISKQVLVWKRIHEYAIIFFKDSL